MSLDTTKSIKSITYNGTEIPLASTASGDTSETWVLNDPITNNITDAVASLATPEFTVEGISYTGFAIQRVRLDLYFNYVNSNTSTQAMYLGLADVGYSFIRWNNQAYRKLTFATPPTGELLTWLQANGVKQEKNLAIQPSKSLTITSNGTTTIMPDVPYNALGQVGVTVNVASSSKGFSITFPATATNWGYSRNMKLFLYDGSVIVANDYSAIANKKVNNVVGLSCGNDYSLWILKMTLASGALVQATMGNDSSGAIEFINYSATQAGSSTATPYGASTVFWWPLTNTVVSAIEMYNTD